jgi:hypothetical protein
VGGVKWTDPDRDRDLWRALGVQRDPGFAFVRGFLWASVFTATAVCIGFLIAAWAGWSL